MRSSRCNQLDSYLPKLAVLGERGALSVTWRPREAAGRTGKTHSGIHQIRRGRYIWARIRNGTLTKYAEYAMEQMRRYGIPASSHIGAEAYWKAATDKAVWQETRTTTFRYQGNPLVDCRGGSVPEPNIRTTSRMKSSGSVMTAWVFMRASLPLFERRTTRLPVAQVLPGRLRQGLGTK